MSLIDLYFREKISGLVVGEKVVVTGVDQSQKDHHMIAFIVSKVDENEFTTTTGNTFRCTGIDKLTSLGIEDFSTLNPGEWVDIQNVPGVESGVYTVYYADSQILILAGGISILPRYSKQVSYADNLKTDHMPVDTLASNKLIQHKGFFINTEKLISEPE